MHVRLPRTVKKDVAFRLLNSPGGSLVDDYQFGDGTTSIQWPTAQFFTGPDGTGTNVTSLFAYDITAETITSASHKHPDGTTGLWRKSIGVYRIRVQPDVSLALTDYYMRVSFYPGPTSLYEEDHQIELISPGDVSFNDSVLDCVDVSDVTAGISTTITDPQIQDLIVEASEWAASELSLCGIDAESFESVPSPVCLAIRYYTRGLILQYDASASRLFTEVQEGSDRIKYAGRSGSDMGSLCDRAADLLKRYCRQNRPGGRPSIGLIRQERTDGAYQWRNDSASDGCC